MISGRLVRASQGVAGVRVRRPSTRASANLLVAECAHGNALLFAARSTNAHDGQRLLGRVAAMAVLVAGLTSSGCSKDERLLPTPSSGHFQPRGAMPTGFEAEPCGEEGATRACRVKLEQGDEVAH